MNDSSPSYKWIVLSILFLNISVGFGGTNIVLPLSSEISRDMDYNLAQVGLTFSFFALATSVHLLARR